MRAAKLPPSAVGYDGSILTPGSRVELHPGLDLWMRGARYGTVLRIAKDAVYVELDAIEGSSYRFAQDRLRGLS